MPKVLIVSHGYPPFGGSGMLRTLKFSRYLPDSGWEPVVLTLARTRHPRIDPKLMAEVPADTAVYRSRAVDPLEALVRLRAAVRRLLRGGREAGKAGGGERAAIAAPDSGAASARGPVSLLKDLLSTPDGYSGWILPGILKGVWVILRHRPRLIFSTSPPPSAHCIGGALAKLSGLPWVVDFRDPWTLQYPDDGPDGRRKRWNRRIETRVINGASRVICNTDPLNAALRCAYPDAKPDKFVTITNGFDPADFPDIREVREGEGGPFTFLHTGEFFPDRNLRVPDPFLEALAELIDSGELNRDTVRVRLIGSGEYTGLPAFSRFAAMPALAGVLDVVDFLPHGEISGELARAHALLLFQNGTEFHMQIPAKAFEYIKAAKPILAVAPAGATAELVLSVAGGRAVAPDDRDDMLAAIRDLLTTRGQALRRGESELQRFTRPALTRRLADCFDTITRRSARDRSTGPEALPVGGARRN